MVRAQFISAVFAIAVTLNLVWGKSVGSLTTSASTTASQQTNDCSYFCNAQYLPVCGQVGEGDFEIYSNACELRKAVCRKNAIGSADDIKCGLVIEIVTYATAVTGDDGYFDDDTSYLSTSYR